jgi:hypothetical protein
MSMFHRPGQYRPLAFVAIGVIAIVIFTLAVGTGPGAERTTASSGPSIAESFSSDYSITSIGGVPGVPDCCGGLTFFFSDPNTIVIGSDPNDVEGAMYTVGVTRDGDDHITGFSGTATRLADAANNDGGVVYGPGDVLFLARYEDPDGWLGQTKPGSAATDKIVDLAPLGVVNPPGGLGFVPEGFPGAGQMKMGSYDDGNWYTLEINPDGTGTYEITSATLELNLGEDAGPEGFAFVPAGSPGFDEPTVLISEYDGDVVSAWDLDSNGDPTLGTRTEFVVDVDGPEGATFDPVTNDFLFTRYRVDEVFVVQGFASPPEFAKGDNNCDGEVQATDALVGLRFNGGLSVNQEPECPLLGSQIGGASSASGEVFGDMDCDQDVDSVDSLFILRWVAALTVNLPEGCAEIGTR